MLPRRRGGIGPDRKTAQWSFGLLCRMLTLILGCRPRLVKKNSTCVRMMYLTDIPLLFTACNRCSAPVLWQYDQSCCSGAMASPNVRVHHEVCDVQGGFVHEYIHDLCASLLPLYCSKCTRSQTRWPWSLQKSACLGLDGVEKLKT